MFTDAEINWYERGCLTGQPRVELGHPEIDIFDVMANPPENASRQPSWFPTPAEEE